MRKWNANGLISNASGSNSRLHANSFLKPANDMFSFFRKLFASKTRPAQPRLVLPSHTQQIREAAGAEEPRRTTGPVPPPKARDEWAKQASRKLDPEASPEQLCGITPDMTGEQVSAQLAMLYRRHNRAASSLEAGLREEAEIMLDVVAAMRQKYLP